MESLFCQLEIDVWKALGKWVRKGEKMQDNYIEVLREKVKI